MPKSIIVTSSVSIPIGRDAFIIFSEHDRADCPHLEAISAA